MELRQGLSSMHLIPFETKSLQLYSPTQGNANLRFHMHESLNFMQQWPFLPVHRLEALRLYKQVPILFYKDHQGQLSLAALLYNEEGHVVKGPKQCVLSYLPVSFRLYPFSWIDQDSATRIAIYSDAPHFQGEGEKLFTSKNKPTQRMRAILHHLGLARKEFINSRQLMKELEQKVVFQSVVINRVNQGQTERLGFLAVDQKSINMDQLSNDLKDLIRIHVTSLKLIPVKNDASPSSSMSIDDIIERICHQFTVTEADILSRKRAEAILNARRELATEASQHEGMMEQLAERLERSPATIKRWMA